MWSHCWLPPSKVRWKNTANFSFFLLWLSWQVTGRGFYGNEGGTTANSWVENLFSRKEREQWCISTSMMWVFLSFALHLPWWSGCVRLHRSKIPVELSKMLTFSWSRNVWLCSLLLFWKVMLLKYFFFNCFLLFLSQACTLQNQTGEDYSVSSSKCIWRWNMSSSDRAFHCSNLTEGFVWL